MNPTAPAPQKKTSRISISNVAALLIATSFLGQILGFLRTKLVNGNFPLHGPHSTDAYFAAFTIPDFFFFTLAAGALGVAFMPVLSDHLHKGDRKGVWELSNSLMNLLALLMLVVGFGMMQGMAASNTVIQTLVPEDMRGRVMSYYTMAFVGMAPFGSLLAGALAHRVGAPHAVMITGAFCVAGAAWFSTQLSSIRAVMRPIYVEMGIIRSEHEPVLEDQAGN